MFRAVRRLHSWPASRHPTPYEIFGMTPQTFSKAQLKKTYIELAKTYHPDRCGHLEDSQRRFKIIGEAYSILRNDSMRNRWDTSHNAPFTPNTSPMGRTPENWRDPYDPDLNTENTEHKFRASLQESRWFFLKVVVSTVIVVAIMELAAVITASDKRAEQLKRLSEQSSMAHKLAFNNYHKGSSAQDRIDRFLAQREHTLTNSEANSFRYADITHRS